MRTEFLMYGAVVVAFGGVVLWATDASPSIVVLLALAAAALLLPLTWLGRGRERMLVVAETGVERPLANAFEAAGFEVWECTGPAEGACPALAGKPCPMHDRPLAAVIVRHEGETRGLAPCGTALRVPALAVEEGSDREPEVVGRVARVGAGRGVDQVLETVDRLVAV
jgi:hypothetical protein